MDGEKLNMETALPGQIVYYESPCDYDIRYGRILWSYNLDSSLDENKRGVKMADDKIIENYEDPLNHITGKELMDRLEKAGISDPAIFEVVKDLPHFTDMPHFILPISRDAIKTKRTEEDKAHAPLISRDALLTRRTFHDPDPGIGGEKVAENMAEILEKAKSLLTFLLANTRIPLSKPVKLECCGRGLASVTVTFLL